MAEILKGLASGDALKSLAPLRARSGDEKTIAAGSLDSLALKLAAEEADGWRVLKRNKRSIRVRRDKPIDRQLEDDVWTLLWRMGFEELNADRNFTIQLSEKVPPRQLDVFAKDRETAFIVECTHSRDNGAKSVKALIDKVGAIREDVIKAVHSHYGGDPKLKIKFAIATRNIDWRTADWARAQDADIAVITEDDIAYFQKLTDILRSTARYQFLARYLRGEKVEGLRAKIPATRGKVGKTTFYNFLISPHDLLRIAYISHKSKSSNEDLETYQRMVKPTRLKALGKHIDDGGVFPTNIVVNTKIEKLRFDIKETFEDTVTGMLSLPGQYGSAWIIDGQHRLYGYAYARREPQDDQSLVSVLAYENLPIREEIQMFVDINTRQVKVSRNLVNEIVASLDIEHDDPKRRLDALCARVALRLDGLSDSPVRGRILTVLQDRTNARCLTLTSLADGIFENNFLGTLSKPGKGAAGIVFHPGPLGEVSTTPQLTLEKASQALAGYFALFADALPEHWALGDAKGGYLCTNLGLRALMKLLRRLTQFVERDGTRTVLLDAPDIVARVAPLVQPLLTYFKTADPADIARFRNRGSSLASVDQNCFQLMAIIHESISSFDPADLKAYIENQDSEGTKRAATMILEINKILFNDVVSVLKEKYSTARDAWWMTGVPASIRIECDKRFNEKNDGRDRWQFLNLVNYATIVTYGDNWNDFKDYYNFYGKGPKGSSVKWIVKINDLRQITHHSEKGPLTRDQVGFVTRVYELVKAHVLERVPVDPKSPGLRDTADAAPEKMLASCTSS